MVPNHKYLADKRISMQGCYGLRVASNGDLLIPLYRGRELISIQGITPDGTKRNFTGAPSKRGVFWIERPEPVITVLAEGFATAATIFESLPTAKVCVTFSAGNLVEVAKWNEWSGLVVVAGDNDDTVCQRHLKEGEGEVFDPIFPRPEWCRCNPGKTAAMEAAKIIGCGWTVPSMETGSDFNDAFVVALTAAEEKEEFAPRKTPPHKLRAAALAPIASALMKAAVFVR